MKRTLNGRFTSTQENKTRRADQRLRRVKIRVTEQHQPTGATRFRQLPSAVASAPSLLPVITTILPFPSLPVPLMGIPTSEKESLT